MDISALWAGAGAFAAGITLPGTIELGMLTAGALLPGRAKAGQKNSEEWRIAVVIPAHNEEASIGDCLDSLFRCERVSAIAEIFVVADNCTDRTASIARIKGARVLERFDEVNRGKGHALGYALQRLVNVPFDAFLVIDADTAVEPNLFAECEAAFGRGAQAIQCPYLVLDSARSASTRLLDLALRGFNLVRPKGRDRLGLSTGILGNGFGMTRDVARRVPYTAFSVVEDLEYHLALVEAGIRVEFLGTTAVYGAMPAGGGGRATQRARWEGGRLRILRERAPWLAGRLMRGQWRFFESLLDLFLLPLALHVPLLCLAMLAPWTAARLAAIAGMTVVAVHLAAAVAYGHSRKTDVRALCSVPGYVLWKLLQMPRIVAASARSTAWVRTARQPEERAA